MSSPNNAINVIIADDEPLACRLLQSYVCRVPDLNLVGAYTSATDALAAIDSGKVQLAFLDIQMPQLSGIELARAVGDRVRVVFVTAYTDYALEGYSVNALHYLLKPVSFEEFCGAVERARQWFARDDASAVITVRSDHRSMRIPVDTITYIEGLKDYVKIHVVGRQFPVVTLMSMKMMAEMLPQPIFMRVHRSFIVNMRMVETVGRSCLTVDGTVVPVGQSYKSDVKRYV